MSRRVDGTSTLNFIKGLLETKSRFENGSDIWLIVQLDEQVHDGWKCHISIIIVKIGYQNSIGRIGQETGRIVVDQDGTLQAITPTNT
jgi:hypothetical protein